MPKPGWNWLVQATRTTTYDGPDGVVLHTVTTGVPSFILPDLLGLITPEAAEQVARQILGSGRPDQGAGRCETHVTVALLGPNLEHTSEFHEAYEESTGQTCPDCRAWETP